MSKPKPFDANTLNGDSEGLILWFDDLGSGNEQFNFLSNFYKGKPITLPGMTYPDSEEVPTFATGEHAYAALKTDDPQWFHAIVDSDPDDPNVCKSLGRKAPLRESWEQIKYDVMAAVVRSKFTLDREEGSRLLATNDAYLCEGTFWGDEVWGVDLTVSGFPGRNWLGTLLMARRAELRASLAYSTFSSRAARRLGGFCENTAGYNIEFTVPAL